MYYLKMYIEEDKSLFIIKHQLLDDAVDGKYSTEFWLSFLGIRPFSDSKLLFSLMQLEKLIYRSGVSNYIIVVLVV